MRTLALIVALVLAGCTHIDRYVEGWPQDMKVVEVRTGFWDVQAECWAGIPFLFKLMLPVVLACTNVNLDTNTCTIYTYYDLDPETDAHERAHCKGGAHDDGLQDYFNEWTAKKG